MGWFDSLFGQKTTTENQQQGTSTTSNNAWGAIQPYMQQYLQQFSAGNIAGAQTPITPYQTAAASSQMGTAANLTPAFTTAGNVASTGISPAAISSYMSPYISNVVDATRNDFNTQNARANAGVQAQAAKMGALTGTQSAVAKNLAMESQRRQQDPIIANLYNQGYGQAANLAQADTNARLAGASTIGQLTNTQTGANTALSGIGGNIWQNQYTNALTPFNLTTQGASGLSPFLNAAGTTTNASGTSSGTSTKTDSPFDIGTDLIAGGIQMAPKLMALSDERAKEDIEPVGRTFDGQPIYTFRYKGSPVTQMGLMAQDVERSKPDAVGLEPYSGLKMVDYDRATRDAKASGGPVGVQPYQGGSEPFHAKVERAFHTIHRMKEFAKGGAVKSRFADGGFVSPAENDPGVNYDPTWGDTTVTAAPQPTLSGAYMDWHKGRQDARKSGGPSDGSSALAEQGRSLSSFMQGLQPRQQFADGGVPSAYWEGSGDAPVPRFASDVAGGPIEPFYAGALPERRVAPRPPVGEPYAVPADRGNDEGWWSRASRYLDTKSGEHGVSNRDRLAMIISGMGGGKVAAQTMKQMEAEREAARLTGRFNGAETMDARRLGLEGARFEEERWRHRLPEYKQIGQTEDGLPIYGWVSAADAARSFAGSAVPPSAAASSYTMPSAPSVPGSVTAAPSAAPAPEAPSRNIRPGVAPQAGVLPGPSFGQQEMDNQYAGLTGEDLLNALEANGQKPRADMLRAIAEGRERFPDNPRNPQERALRRQVMQYDPTLDAATFQTRAATLKDWNAGPTSKNIAAINTAARHAADLYKAIDDLGTSDVTGGKWTRQLLGGFYEQKPKYAQKLRTFEAKKLALAEEASKAFHGGPSVSGVEEWKKNFMAAESPGALRAATAALVKLLEGRVEELDSNYFRAMGKEPKRPSLSPAAREEYDLIKKAAAENKKLEDFKKERLREPKKEEKGAINGRASGPSVAKETQDRLPEAAPGTERNPIPVTSPEEAAKLPSGTYIKTPKGVKVVP